VRLQGAQVKKSTRNRWLVSSIVLILFLINVSAQSPSSSRRLPADNRRIIANDTFRELMKAERETPIGRPNTSAERAAVLKQMVGDFKSIQLVNNKMMAAAWAGEEINYGNTANLLDEINTIAVRLKNNLSLPEPENAKGRDLKVTGSKQFKLALLAMDHSLMSFVNNPIFRERNVVEVKAAQRATQDLEDVIDLSLRLKKIAGTLKNSPADH